ncbi:MAG TPA: DUF1203 domain-containing protein [Mycobacteriales bacterium]|nr:DUF1203 domain-containing protein [Mycobacteriales bacterium]
MQTKTTYAVHAISPAVCAELRERDDTGNLPELVVDEGGGSPLRCCLDVSRPGERILLASYAPLRRWAELTGATPGPYDEIGPVFLHQHPCNGAADAGYPDAYRDWPRVLRAYDSNGRIIGGELLAEGDDPDPVIDMLFCDARVSMIHARAVTYGCFTFAITRAA